MPLALLLRARALLQRYGRAHLRLEQAGCPLTDGEKQLGEVARMTLEAGQLTVRGMARAHGLRLESEGRSALVHLPGDALSPFSLTLPHGAATLFVLRHDRDEICVALPPFSRRAWRLGQARLLGPLLVTLFKARRPLLAWLRHGDAAGKAALKRALGFEPPRRVPAFEPDALLAGKAVELAGPPPAIILPVHNAGLLARETLRRLAEHTRWEGGAVRVVLIDDGSTEAGLAAALKAWALLHDSAPHLSITHWRHEAARGFIATVNAGFAHLEASGHRGAVILLNSDAFVPAGWLPRLLAPLSDPKVASATPMSNAAEIASAPALCRNTPLAPGHGDAMDAVAAGLGAGAIDAPTGVGFCMALGAAWWQALPRFDTAFGAGYGEEVDWCRRVA
ncbi:MAG: glycosyltransferase, partial [Pseudomonadota bacterium]